MTTPVGSKNDPFALVDYVKTTSEGEFEVVHSNQYNETALQEDAELDSQAESSSNTQSLENPKRSHTATGEEFKLAHCPRSPKKEETAKTPSPKENQNLPPHGDYVVETTFEEDFEVVDSTRYDKTEPQENAEFDSPEESSSDTQSLESPKRSHTATGEEFHSPCSRKKEEPEQTPSSEENKSLLSELDSPEERSSSMQSLENRPKPFCEMNRKELEKFFLSNNPEDRGLAFQRVKAIKERPILLDLLNEAPSSISFVSSSQLQSLDVLDDLNEKHRSYLFPIEGENKELLWTLNFCILTQLQREKIWPFLPTKVRRFYLDKFIPAREAPKPSQDLEAANNTP